MTDAPADLSSPPSDPLHLLAETLGIARTWWDVEGCERTVCDASLMQVCTALGFPADSPEAIAHSLERAAAENALAPVMLVTHVGRATPLPASLCPASLMLGDGSRRPLDYAEWTLAPVDEPGYYAIEVNGHALTLAVAPETCPTVEDVLPQARKGEKVWGSAVQIPSLRATEPRPFGNFADLAEAARLLGEKGADAVAINPVHALFPGWGHDFSPYSPSSRLYLNTAMGDPALIGLPPLPSDPPREADADAAALIDWEAALPRRLAQLRTVFAGLGASTRARIAAENAAHDADCGGGLTLQAIYDALDCRYRPKGARGWQEWPKKYRTPSGKAVARFAKEHAEEVEFHLFAQWLSRASLAAAQSAALEAGMAIGLVADLAVGVHTGGSDSWALQGAMLEGLTIGAPPDPLGPLGQNWALTTFSPAGLRRTGYAPWIATLRTALSLTGALRIDHAFGLARLWVVPEGEHSSAGAYLAYPFEDLLRLAALEAHLAGALIITEDLGTAPHGFAQAIAEKRMSGMQVLWFERAADDGFIGAADYSPGAVAMTGTHDTATVAGWWTGRDLDWAEQLGRLPQGTTREDAESRRDWDRGLLWASLTHNESPRPPASDPAPVLDAALRHIGHTPCPLAIAPLEDLLGEVEQPNLPGTVTEHPNWRRRLAAPLSEMLDDPQVQARIAALDAARGEPQA